MDHGRKVAEGPPGEILRNSGNERLRTFLSRIEFKQD
jgi:ABC-type polar amino acid transport system ATPase subunit